MRQDPDQRNRRTGPQDTVTRLSDEAFDQTIQQKDLSLHETARNTRGVKSVNEVRGAHSEHPWWTQGQNSNCVSRFIQSQSTVQRSRTSEQIFFHLLIKTHELQRKRENFKMHNTEHFDARH